MLGFQEYAAERRARARKEKWSEWAAGSSISPETQPAESSM